MINVSDFNITGRAIPQKVADKIVKYHLVYLWEVEKSLPFEIWVSQKSGYRPYWYEIKKGRDGSSQHTFSMKGAVDLTCEDFFQNKEEFLQSLIINTNYTRIAEYNSFYHCDHREVLGGGRWLFNSKWERIRKLE